MFVEAREVLSILIVQSKTRTSSHEYFPKIVQRMAPQSGHTRCLATLATKNAAQLFIGHGIWPSRSNLLYKLSKLIVTFYLEIFRCTSKILCQVVYCSVQDPITRSINLFRQSSGISTKGTVEQIQQEGRHKAPLYT